MITVRVGTIARVALFTAAVAVVVTAVLVVKLMSAAHVCS